MSLRTRILIFLSSFGLIPLLIAVVINLPLVLDRVALFYQHAFLQNLRADFRDLDQHIASRDEMVRLLAKLPEPGLVMGISSEDSQIDLARARYTEWINRVLRDQLDILDVVFLDEEGAIRFWLERNPETFRWEPTLSKPKRPHEESLQMLLERGQPGVQLSPLRVDSAAVNPGRALTLQLLATLDWGETGRPKGIVVMTVSVGGLVKSNPNTLWVHHDGRYLQAPGLPERQGSAFDDFPGLTQQVSQEKIFLWEGDDELDKVIWVPLLHTDDGQPLWVGRSVDRQPLEDLQDALRLRVLGIILILVVVILLVSRWYANRMQSFGQQLTAGIRSMLEEGRAIDFSWKGSREMVQLGDDLSQLSKTHARNSRNLKAHTKELEESNRYKSQFLANVSHELRTPLNSILLLSKMLADKGSGLNQEQHQQARVIHQAGTDLRNMIDNILDLSRIEAGHQQLHLESVVLYELVEDVLELMRPQFDAKGLSLEYVAKESFTDAVETDPDKLRQILKNFLANAVKFTTSGGVKVEVEKVEGDLPVCIRVTDTGIGIEKSKQAIIFEAFKQADGTTSRRYGGTGLGLAISRELAKMLGGDIHLQSQPGEGSVFSLCLPLCCDTKADENMLSQEEPLEPASDIAEPETLPQADFSGHSALIVDTDVQRLLHITPILETWGLEVFAAADHDEALETLDEVNSCLLLVAEGYDTISKVRNLSSCEELTLIALVTDLDQEKRDSVIHSGLDDCVSLPLNPEELKNVLSRHMK